MPAQDRFNIPQTRTTDSTALLQCGVSGERAPKPPTMDETAEFLEGLKEESLSEKFPPFPIAERAINFWTDLKQKFWASGLEGTVPPPTIGVGSSGQILFSWNLDDGYLECEIFQSRSEVFHENLRTGSVELEDLNQTGEAEANWLIKRLAEHF